MKAILSMKPGGTGGQNRATYLRLYYVFKARKKGTDGEDRVTWFGGDLDGYGLVQRDASQMSIAMDCGHEHLDGRRTRHAILSCEPCDDETRADAEARLRASAPLLAAVLGARRWIAVIHRDTAKPHLHLVLANFDEDRERRFDFRPEFLSGLQEMEWTPFLEKGKGEHVPNRGSRGKIIEAVTQLGAANRAEKKEGTVKKLHAFLKKNKALDMNPDALVNWLWEHLALPPGWKVAKLRSKTGKPKRNPALVIDGEGLRITRFFEYKKAKKMSKTKRVEDVKHKK